MNEIPLYTGEEVYRPLWEQDSVLLEVALGCSWHSCAFCDFAKDPFSMFSLEEIEEKAKMLVPYAQNKKRIFLLGENPFVLSTSKLLAVFDMIHLYMPWIKEISMYARFDDILRKSLQELKTMNQRGLAHLHIGMESGNDEVLKQMNKGTTAGDAEHACRLLHESGITFSLTIIPGLGGKALSKAHAADTAALLNKVQPDRLWLIGLKVWPDTPLFDMCQAGIFTPLTLQERLEEVYCLIQLLELKQCSFAATTILDKYSLMGRLPDNKESFLSHIDKLLGRS